MTKSEWIESEYKKWEDRFDIPFEDEFNVKALLGLRYDFFKAPESHTKSKSDLINAMEKLQKSMNFLRKNKDVPKEKSKIIIVVDNCNEIKSITDMFLHNTAKNIVSVRQSNHESEINTNEFDILIILNSENTRGYRCNVLINATNDESVLKRVKTISV